MVNFLLFILLFQLSDNYESIYGGSSCGYGCNGQLSPTKSTKSPSVSSPSQPHHYISSYRARASLSRRTGSKVAAAATSASTSSSSSSTLDRVGVDPCQRLQLILKQRYQQLCDTHCGVSWCPDFRLTVRQMVFSLARDSSWEKGTATPQRPNLRRIPLHGIFAEDRVGNSTHFMIVDFLNKIKQNRVNALLLCVLLEI